MAPSDSPAPGRTVPDLVVIGAPRAGTTSLYRYLQEHPAICMSRFKEPSFFACGAPAIEAVGNGVPLADDTILARSVLTWDDYEALFAAAGPGQKLGEASPTYMYATHVPSVLARYAPDVKLVACLRQPVERAFSHIAIATGRTASAGELAAALSDQSAHPRTTLQDTDDYLRPGLYGQHLARWFDVFGRDSVHVVRHERLDHDTGAAMADVYAFAGVDAAFAPDVSVRYNQSGGFDRFSITNVTRRLVPYAQRLGQHLPAGVAHRLAKTRARVRDAERTTSALSPEDRRELTERYFAADIAHLTALTGDDYADWLA